jgi:hypothetical protein
MDPRLRRRTDMLPVFRLGGLGRLLAVLPVELVDAAGRVDQLLLAGEEGVAGIADFDVEILLSGPRLERVATDAGDGRLVVRGVETFLHGPSGSFERSMSGPTRSPLRSGQVGAGAKSSGGLGQRL